MQIKCVVFDMAGTTIDEDNIVYKTLHLALTQFNLPISLEQVLLHGAGKEKFQAVKDIINNAGVAIDEMVQFDIYNIFLAKLELAYNEFRPKPMPNAEKVFEILKSNGIKVVLNTGYNKPTAINLLSKLGWEIGNQIDLLVTASDVIHNRPMPDMISLRKRHLV